jgi:gamma-glutamyltranspeptidase
MAPVIVLDREGRFVAALGSPGGSAIQAYNLKALVGLLDWRLGAQEATALPNLVARGSSFSGDPAQFAPAVVEGLAARGVVLVPGRAENSGVHIIRRVPRAMKAAPIRAGTASRADTDPLGAGRPAQTEPVQTRLVRAASSEVEMRPSRTHAQRACLDYVLDKLELRST